MSKIEIDYNFYCKMIEVMSKLYVRGDQEDYDAMHEILSEITNDFRNEFTALLTTHDDVNKVE